MCLLGGKGAVITPPSVDLPKSALFFGEDQGRYLLTCDMEKSEALLQAAGEQGVPAVWIGATGDSLLAIEGEESIALQELRDAHESWMPRFMREVN